MMLAEGFRDWKIGDLAARLRCSRSTLYKLASSKDELILLVVERILEQAVDDLRAAVDAPGRSAADRVQAYMIVVGEWQGRGSIAFWQDVAENPGATALFAHRPGAKVLAAVLEEGISSGEFRPLNVGFTTRLLLAGAALSQDPDVLREVGLDAGEAVVQFVDTLLWGLMGSPGPSPKET